MTTTVQNSSASASDAHAADEVDLLLAFVHERDHPCPRCGYNLRNLTKPICPECHEALVLKVGLHRLKLHWLLLTLAPGIFCGIGVGFFIGMSIFHGLPGLMTEVLLTLLFLTISGIVALWLALHARTFLRLPDGVQCALAIATWAFHLVAFVLFAMYA